jgi:hypothetical protein
MPVSLRLEDAITPANELGQEIASRIERDVGKISYACVNPNGATAHIVVRVDGGEVHRYNLLRDNRDPNAKKAEQASAEGVSAESAALYRLLNDEQRATLAEANPALARKYESQPTESDRDPLKQLNWVGYVNTAPTLRLRVQALRDGEDWIDGLLAKRSLAVVVGDSGEGKSPLIYQQAFCIAAGVPFLGRTTRQGRVLVVDYENGQGQVLGMLQKFAYYFKVPLPPDLYLVNANDVPPEWESSGHTLLNLIEDFRPSVVMIDSLGSAFPEIEGKNETANRKYKEFREVISSTGTSIQFITHTKKVSDDPKCKPVRLEDGNLRRWFHQTRGARSIINGSDIRLAVEGHSQADLIVRGFRRVAGELPTIYLRRALADDGRTPLAYEQVTGAGLLFNQEQTGAFEKLHNKFAFSDAARIYGKGDQPTRNWLKKCIDLGILEQPVGRGAYMKIQASGGVNRAEK